MLVNAPKYRIQKYPRGFVVEMKVTDIKFLFFKYTKWVHVISYAGLIDSPFYYDTFQRAYYDFVKLQKLQINFDID